MRTSLQGRHRGWVVEGDFRPSSVRMVMTFVGQSFDPCRGCHEVTHSHAADPTSPSLLDNCPVSQQPSSKGTTCSASGTLRISGTGVPRSPILSLYHAHLSNTASTAQLPASASASAAPLPAVHLSEVCPCFACSSLASSPWHVLGQTIASSVASSHILGSEGTPIKAWAHPCKPSCYGLTCLYGLTCRFILLSSWVMIIALPAASALLKRVLGLPQVEPVAARGKLMLCSLATQSSFRHSPAACFVCVAVRGACIHFLQEGQYTSCRRDKGTRMCS